MNKNLAMLALLGLTSGLVVSCKMNENKQQPGGNQKKTAGQVAPAQQSMTADEKAFYNKLNMEGKKTFEQMNSADRQKAMRTANAGCQGRNECKGLGGCATDEHECKGENDCKGKGGCAVTDPNDAVKLVKEASSKNK
jgi:hypothetical protein